MVSKLDRHLTDDRHKESTFRHIRFNNPLLFCLLRCVAEATRRADFHTADPYCVSVSSVKLVHFPQGLEKRETIE